MQLRSTTASQRQTRITPARLSCLALVAILHSVMLSASQSDDPAWRNFQHALGKPALIGANADHPRANSAYRPIPAPAPQDIDADRFKLGFDLFHEGRLSSANSIACVTCHAGALSGADRRQVSVGVGGARGTMNALSVFNATFNFRQFWDGRAVTLEDQALEPIQDEVEMAHSLGAALQMLQSDSEYSEKFAAVYPDGITINNLADALAHFQRFNFIRLDTPFQRHLRGEDDALSDQERQGWQRFEEVGCVNCHNGINLGGNSYQKLGAALPYYGRDRQAGPHDIGIKGRSGRERDRHVFRVPGLHGVATTPPYFHDGSIATLDEAIEEMAEHQLGRQLSQQDVDDIAAFLRSLGGRPSGGTSNQSADEASGDESRTQMVSHTEAYQAAIEAIETTANRLLPEMQRIHSGEVAHFDFLQFQHRELIRHARALHHPPSSLNGVQRNRLVSEAQQLLTEVNALEWIIADFLRAEAMTRVFSAHMDAPGDGHLAGQPGEITAGLQEQRALSRKAMNDIASVDGADLALGLHLSYQTGN